MFGRNQAVTFHRSRQSLICFFKTVMRMSQDLQQSNFWATSHNAWVSRCYSAGHLRSSKWGQVSILHVRKLISRVWDTGCPGHRLLRKRSVWGSSSLPVWSNIVHFEGYSFFPLFLSSFKRGTDHLNWQSDLWWPLNLMSLTFQRQ